MNNTFPLIFSICKNDTITSTIQDDPIDHYVSFSWRTGKYLWRKADQLQTIIVESVNMKKWNLIAKVSEHFFDLERAFLFQFAATLKDEQPRISVRVHLLTTRHEMNWWSSSNFCFTIDSKFSLSIEEKQTFWSTSKWNDLQTQYEQDIFRLCKWRSAWVITAAISTALRRKTNWWKTDEITIISIEVSS